MTPSCEVIRTGPLWFIRPSPGVRSIFSRCGGSFWCARDQATRSFLGLLCGFEVDELSCGEDDELLSGTGEAIDDDVDDDVDDDDDDDDLIGVAVVCG
jgi:hypothetical protein